MRVFIYNGGLRLVGKSGVGQAILHQREMLRRARIDTADHWCQRAGAVHINTVLPDAVLPPLADVDVPVLPPRTRTRQVPLPEPSVTVRVACPEEMAVTRPVESTEAMPSSLLLQV